MSRNKDKGRLPPFVPVDRDDAVRSPAWRATSHGARWLYVHLKLRWRWRQKNNGRVYISQRDAMEEMGCGHRDSISRWFRELEFYGFIAKTAEGCLGVDGMGKAPQWRLTEADGPGGRNGDTWSLPTKDYLKWDGTLFEDERGEVKRKRLRTETRPGKRGLGGLESEARPGPESEATSLGNWPANAGHIRRGRWPANAGHI